MFSFQFSSFRVELCHKPTVLYPFYTKYAQINRNYLKMSGFSSRIVRYPGYQDTALVQLCVKNVNNLRNKHILAALGLHAEQHCIDFKIQNCQSGRRSLEKGHSTGYRVLQTFYEKSTERRKEKGMGNCGESRQQ